jgi:hypothetical protein
VESVENGCLLNFKPAVKTVGFAALMKNKPLILEELLIWLRGRFTLTGEEKIWILLVLVICWAALAGRYFYLRNQKTEPLPPQKIEEVLRP